MRKLFSIEKLITSAVILITIIFLLPLFIGGLGESSISELFSDTSNGFSSSLQRTITFALISSILNVLGGFFLALLLSEISINSKLGKQLSFLILPVTLGNVAVVFVFKVLLFNTDFFNTIVQGGNITQLLFLLCIQFWQFGFLFTYLFWLNIQNTSKQIDDYSKIVKLSRFEKIRDIILPQSKNLFILLLFIGFMFSFYEDTKSQYLFRASQGTETELINHWLYRTYQLNLSINPEHAKQTIFKIGLIVFIITLFSLAILGSLALISLRIFLNIRNVSQKEIASKRNIVSAVIAVLSIITIIAPVLMALAKSKYQFSEDIFSFFLPFALTLIAALAATIFAIAFGISSRLTFPKLLCDFNSKSLIYFLMIFLLEIIPPLCIVLCGFKWLSWIGYSYDELIYFIWVVGHCILTLPLLGSFILATHFSVRQNELNYWIAYKTPIYIIMKYSFVKRFKAEYTLTLLFAFTFIWNDTVLNMILSDKILSFAIRLKMLFIGRATNYSKATSFVLIAILISLGCVFIWQHITSKEKINEAK